ncbi:MAG TPA: GvpL/GvpF family gas vesicle protein, partial [Thermoleophilia bacterium]|nr:GvpL/GvpF family gas vesicle protein [Thermoleophilia bacterium]
QAVLPVKFGTVLASAGEVCTALDRWHGRLASALEQLGNMVEIEVAASWDLGQTFDQIGRQPRIAALAASLVGRSDRDTMDTRVQIGRLVKEELDRRREEYRQEVVSSLTCLARDVQANPLPSDELVLNVAFLIERAQLDDFYARVQQLDRSLQSQLTFRCIGPLPPYSFGTVEITRPRAEEIDAARRLMGLGEQASEAEIAASYRRLAPHCHPDRHPEDPLAPGRFAALATAHAQLLAYMRGQCTVDSPGREVDRPYDLAPAAVEASLLLTIKRSQSQPVAYARAS